MANRFWVGGAATWDATAGTKWALTSGGAGGQAVPTAADDVFFDAASGANNVTLSASSLARSINCTGFTGTITHPAATTLTIGDATAGASNIALNLVAGMTYTLGNVATSAITFASTSATVQTVNFGGKTCGNVTFGTSGTPAYAVTSALACDSTATITSAFGNLQLDGVSNNSGLSHSIGTFAASASNVRTINLGAATITLTRTTGAYWNMNTTANITLVAGTSHIISTGGLTAGGALSFTSGNKTYYNLTQQGPAENTIIAGTGGTATFNNVTRVGPADLLNYNQISLGLAVGTVKVTGTLKVWGDDETKRAQIWPNSNAMPCRLDITGATLDFKYVNFQDVIFINGGGNLDLSAVVGGSSDNGGNVLLGGGSLIFTPAVTQVWQTTGAGNWSDPSKWTSRIPLGQDPVVFSSAFVGSPTIACDMPYSCGSLTVTGSGNVTLRADRTITDIVGSFVGRSGLTLSAASQCSWYFNARKAETINLNGTTVTASLQVSAGNGGEYTFTGGGTLSALQHRSGPINVPLGTTLSTGSYVSNATNTAAPAIMNVYGILALGSTGTVLSLVQGPSFTSFPDVGGEIRLTNTAAGAKSFQGGGTSYPKVTVVGGGAGAFNFTGSNTFPRIPFPYSAGTATITFASGTTTTITSPGADDFANGTSVVTIRSSTGGSAATISKANGLVRGDYLSLQDLTATGGAVFRAGANSTNVSGNTGWTFTAAAGWVPQMLMAA